MTPARTQVATASSPSNASSIELRLDERPSVLVEAVLASDAVEPCERIVGVSVERHVVSVVAAADSSCGMALTMADGAVQTEPRQPPTRRSMWRAQGRERRRDRPRRESEQYTGLRRCTVEYTALSETRELSAAGLFAGQCQLLRG